MPRGKSRKPVFGAAYLSTVAQHWINAFIKLILVNMGVAWRMKKAVSR